MRSFNIEVTTKPHKRRGYLALLAEARYADNIFTY